MFGCEKQRKIIFIPRYKFETMPLNESMAVISIGDYNQDMPLLRGVPSKFLRVKFSDVTSADVENFHLKEAVLFNAENAKSIIEFVREVKLMDDIVSFVIHCEAGVSRSAAVALYVYNELGWDFEKYEEANFANKMVVDMLAKESGLKIEIPVCSSDKSKIIFF